MKEFTNLYKDHTWVKTNVAEYNDDHQEVEEKIYRAHDGSWVITNHGRWWSCFS